MKYLKTGIINNYGAANGGFVVNPFGRITTNSTNSLKIPTGTTAQRPQASLVAEGVIRYNLDDHKIEGYINGAWETVKGPADLTIVRQTIAGDPDEVLYGPLTQEPANNDNALVFVENVIQLYGDNYTFVVDPPGNSPSTGVPYPAGTYIQFTDSESVPNSININVYFGFDL